MTVNFKADGSADILPPEDDGRKPTVPPPKPSDACRSVTPAAQGRDFLRFVDAVSPFVRDVLDEPFPWKHGGQVTVVMTRQEYDEAVAALEALRD